MIIHIGILPYPGRRIILETIKKVHKENKPCMYSYSVTIAADEMGFMYILPITVITKKTSLYKAKLRNSAKKLGISEKDLDARQLCFKKKYLFLFGIKTDMSFINLSR